MNPNIRRLLLGAILATSTTGATLGVGMEAASAASTVNVTVRTAGGPLNLRAGPTTQSATAGQVPNWTSLTVSCQTSGQYVSGAIRNSAQWDRLTSGRYVAHAYVQTNASIPSCSSVDTPPPASAPSNPYPYVHTDGGPLSIRSGPSSRSDRTGTIPNWNGVDLSCQVNGETVRGTVRTTAQWDKLTRGGYISHAYVRTGLPVPACVAGPAPAPAPSPAPAPAPTTYAGTAHTEGGPLNIRGGPSTGSAPRGAVSNGSALTLACAVSGDYVRGAVRSTSQWDQLASGNYVSHAYVQTSATLPTCAGGAPVTGAP
ncbi:MAG TPA: hypothetical protein VGP31_19315, partial [Planosporangium sp.]|nr:hypothetical protein [Planosporangium sp.]